MIESYPLTGLVLAFALGVYVWVGLRVGAARTRYGVKAPSVEGPPEFDRIFRTQMNTLEQLVLFMPALGLFAATWGDAAAAAAGVFWPLGRIHYAIAYVQSPDKSMPGFIAAFSVSMILLAGGVLGALISIF
jgi:glutathione S-transferase